MVTCKDFQDFVSDFVDGELPPPIQKKFREHLASCHYCTYVYNNVAKVCTILKNLDKVQTSDSFELRLRQRLLEESERKETGLAQWLPSGNIVNGKMLAGAGAALVLVTGIVAFHQQGTPDASGLLPSSLNKSNNNYTPISTTQGIKPQDNSISISNKEPDQAGPSEDSTTQNLDVKKDLGDKVKYVEK
ncbi:MAG: zf-HC2 domain-containing protein [Patescibacteria group bacterium]|nr:zf-HC2 domain-containing protein [Patescibacteria group bacterium]